MSECSNGGLSVWYLINKKELNKQWFLFDNLSYFLLVLKKERKKSIFRYSNFLSMSQLCTLGSCHSPKFGEGESAAERVGSLDPCSTLTAPPTLHQDLPKASEVRVTRQEPRNPEINGKISTDFRQVNVSSRHFCSRHSNFLFHLFQQPIKHISTNPYPTSTAGQLMDNPTMLSCLALQVNKAEWSTLGMRMTLLAAWDGGIHAEGVPTCLHETGSEVHNKDNSILLWKKHEVENTQVHRIHTCIFFLEVWFQGMYNDVN